MIEIHQQPRRNAPHFLAETFFYFSFLITIVESAVKCLIFRRRPFFWSAGGGPAGTLLGLDVALGTRSLPAPDL